MPRSSRTSAGVGCLLLVGIFLFVSYSTALRKSATIDEPLHKDQPPREILGGKVYLFDYSR
jgi:hypothetical protein